MNPHAAPYYPLALFHAPLDVAPEEVILQVPQLIRLIEHERPRNSLEELRHKCGPTPGGLHDANDVCLLGRLSNFRCKSRGIDQLSAKL